MVMDYRERKLVQKNRPKKQGVGGYVLLLLLVAAISFAVGVAADRFLFNRPNKQVVALPSTNPPTAPGQPQGGQAQPPAAAPAQVPGTPLKTNEPPLTFYDTLSKGGGKAVLGSGLNPGISAHQQAAKPAPPPAAPSAQPPAPAAKPESSPKHVEEKPRPTVPSAQPEKPKPAASETRPAATPQPAVAAKTRYTVQIASYRDKKEAEEIRARLVNRGYAAFLVELKEPGKGVWYRIRVGRQLEQGQANELAGKLGKGAILVPE